MTKYAILQVALDKYGKKWKSFDEIQTNAKEYEVAYVGEWEEPKRARKEFDLEAVYAKFNRGLHPADYYGHSVSMGDVIVAKENNTYNAYYVDRYGYVSLDTFVNDEIIRKIENRESVGVEYEKLFSKKRESLTKQEQERLDYLENNYRLIIEMAKDRELIFKNQKSLKEIYEIEQREDLPTKNIQVIDDIYWFNDTSINDLSRAERTKKIAVLYADILSEYMSQEQKEAHIYGMELSLDYRLNVSEADYLLYERLIKERAERKKKVIAIESTEDYTDTNFHKNLVDLDTIIDGAYGREKDFFRLVTVDVDGKVKPIDERIYESIEQARIDIDTSRYTEINYDDIIYMTQDKQREIAMQRLKEQERNNDMSEEIYKPSSEELTEDEQKREAILQGVGAVMSSEGFANYASTINKLMYNKFSPRNCNMILSQYIMRYCDENNIDVRTISNKEMMNIINTALKSENVPTYLMGYEAWKDYGRQVSGKNVAYSIYAPNYVTEYNGKGTIIRAMEKKFNSDFAKDSNIPYSEFALGKTGLVFRGYGTKGNYLVDVCLKDTTILGKQTIEDVRKYLDNDVIGKMVSGYSVTYVYDVKNTVVPEHLWVKNNYKKTELVTDEDGQPITRKPYKNANAVEYKILNTDERKNKFKPDLSMEVTGLVKEKAEILFDTLKDVSAKKGVPITVEKFNSGARGFYQIEEKRIAISDNLDIESMCATAIHEMAHADLHSMPNTKNRSTKEVEAEAVSYITSRHFGLYTDVKSFNYLASWSSGRDLKELESSMNVILKESKKLELEISNELEARGYTHLIDKIEEIEDVQEKLSTNVDKKVQEQEQENDIDDRSKEEIVNYVKSYKEFILGETDNIANLKDNANSLLEQSADPRLSEIVKEQIDILNKQKRKVVTIDNNLNQLENASSQADVKKYIDRVDKYYNEFNELKIKFNSLSYEYMDRLHDVKSMAKENVKDKYIADPIGTLKDYINKSDNENFKKLSDTDLKYISSSDYMNRSFGKYITTDMDKFLEAGVERVEHINEVQSKNGQFIEVSMCEQWFEKPIVENGALIHPSTANKILGEAEKDIAKLKEVASKNDEYIPYSKCKMTVFTKNDNTYLTTQVRMDIGDGCQSDLTSFLEQNCRNEKVMQIYSKSVKERVADKIYEPSVKKMTENIDKTRPHGEDGKNTLSADELKKFVSYAVSEHDVSEHDHSKQRVHDRGSMRK